MSRRSQGCWISWVIFGVGCGIVSAVCGQTPRPLAPGVLTVIQPEILPEDTFQGPLALTEITKGGAGLSWTPHTLARTETLLAMAQQVTLRRPIWGLEFSFKPLRMVAVDLPHPSGRLERKLVWYMVYRIRYFGNDLVPAPSRDSFGHVTYPGTVPGTSSPRFFPHFVLRGHDTNKEYLDVVLPSAKEAIAERERPGVPLHHSVEMTRQQLPVSQDASDPGVWGYVTWTDIDPRTTFFSIYVYGLTNAFRFVEQQDAFQPGSPPLTGRRFQQKVLQLNFWRPGDSVLLHEGEIRFGVPYDPDPQLQQQMLSRYGLQKRLDYLWIYR
ncbi:MAG: hypothetical protein KatS3mg110_3511 [Pirellulaceae bacterium]|nr:MAG: hypothetical protein KatS3mg110_3511 [Pirellulaceae bacterium]